MTRDAYEAMAGCARRRIAGEWVCTDAERAVLGLVNELSYALGQSFALVPCLGDFAAVIGMHKSTVSRAIRSALKKGFLIIMKRRDETLYSVCLETPGTVATGAAVNSDAAKKRLVTLNENRLQGMADGNGQGRLPGILPNEEADAPVRAFGVMMESLMGAGGAGDDLTGLTGPTCREEVALSSTVGVGAAQGEEQGRPNFVEGRDFSSTSARGMPVERSNEMCDLAGEDLTGGTGETCGTEAKEEESIEEKLHRVGEEMRRRWEAGLPLVEPRVQPRETRIQETGEFLPPMGRLETPVATAAPEVSSPSRPPVRKGKYRPATWEEMSRGLRGDALHALELLKEECFLAGPREEAAFFQFGLTWRKRCTRWPREMAEAAGVCKAMRLEGSKVRTPGGFVWNELCKMVDVTAGV
jgi:hypothetical protein